MATAQALARFPNPTSDCSTPYKPTRARLAYRGLPVRCAFAKMPVQVIQKFNHIQALALQGTSTSEIYGRFGVFRITTHL